LRTTYTRSSTARAIPATDSKNGWLFGKRRVKKMNLIGRQVSRLRYQRGWTQDMLADKLQLAGWMISRSGVSKIENGSMYVSDFRLFYFAHIFGIEISQLFVNVNIQFGVVSVMSAKRPTGDSADKMIKFTSFKAKEEHTRLCQRRTADERRTPVSACFVLFGPALT
jgi:transcriptional regulator with XRE-family HTH domain